MGSIIFPGLVPIVSCFLVLIRDRFSVCMRHAVDYDFNRDDERCVIPKKGEFVAL